METAEPKNVGIIADIIECKQSEGQLHQLNEALKAKDIEQYQQYQQASRLLAAIVESSNDAIITKTLDSIITSWNIAAEKLFGYSQAEAVGQSISILFPPERMEEETQILEHLKRGERVNHFETVRLRKDGTPVDVSVTISPLRDEAGEIVGASKIVRDITERKRQENQLRDITSALNETAIVAITDAQGTITFVNDKFCEISKYSREELIGQNHRILNSGHHPREFFVEMWTTIAHGKTWRAEIKNRAKDGSFYWVDTTIVPFLNARGKPYQYLAIRSDITERKLAEIKLKIEMEEHKRTMQGLQRLTKSLEESNRELQDFAYVSSHDLQEPLRKIQAFGDYLKSTCQDSLSEKGRDCLERMLNAASRAQVLINDLLAFSRVTTKAKPFEPVDLSEVLEGVLSDLEIRIEQTGATIEADRLPVVQVDALQMRQIFQNLLSNALKFRREGVASLIQVRSHLYQQQGRDYCELRIIDNGIGFEQKYADRIFRIFERLHGRKTYQGSGVGLAICRKIAKRHGGTLIAQSELGQGATFILTLPVHQTEGEFHVQTV